MEDKKVKKEKKNGGLKVALVIFILISLGLSLFIVYDKTDWLDGIIKKDKKVVEDKKEDTTSKEKSMKLDETKNWVYDADYNLPTDKESYNGLNDHSKLISKKDLTVPYININTDDAKKVNQELYKLYEKLIALFNSNLDDEIWYTIVKYKTYVNDNVLSIVVATESGGTAPLMYEYYAYNFNLNDGKILDIKDAYDIAGFNEETFKTKAKTVITNDITKYMEDMDEAPQTYIDQTMENLNTTLTNNSTKFFIDDDKNIRVVVVKIVPAGSGEFQTVYKIEK